MKFSLACLALSLLCPLLPAQTIAIVRGQKVLVDEKGNVIVPVPSQNPPPAPLVGGADSCVTPDVLTGTGPYAFDTTTATTGTQGQNEAICLNAGLIGLNRDVWFTWTSTFTGNAYLTMCGTATFDTKVAVYPGNTCPTAAALACNDDFCGLQSTLQFNAVMGNNYVIQVGQWGTGTPSPGTFALYQPPPPPSNDTCTAPVTIVGTGTFAFDTTWATTSAEGQNESLCNIGGLTAISHDTWFTWVAPFTGTARVSTCGGTTSDTKIAAYGGTACPASGSALACSDTACGAQSQVDFSATQGSSYILQIGNYNTAAGGSGTFTVNQYVPVALDDCQLPGVLTGPGPYAYDTTLATNSPQAAACGGIYFDQWYTYTATQGGTATLTTCGLITSTYVDTKVAIYNGVGCPTSASIACVDDATCAVQSGLTTTLTWPAVCGQQYTIRMGSFGQSGIVGSFSINVNGTQCGPTGTPFCFGDGSGTACPCGNAGAPGNGCASSVSPGGANLTTTGNSVLANDTLVLRGSAMPNSSCLYFQGTTQISSIFGDGLRCAGGSVIRLGTKTNVAGASQYPAAGDPTVSVKGAVTAPGTRTYQTWYRNAAAFCSPSTFNLTNGMSVTWQ